MNLVTVDSTMLHAVGYDAERRELEVIFNTGHIYLYKNVPAETYQRLMTAESIGQFMQAQVIGIFPYVRLSRRPAARRHPTRTAKPYRPAGPYRRTTKAVRRKRASH